MNKDEEIAYLRGKSGHECRHFTIEELKAIIFPESLSDQERSKFTSQIEEKLIRIRKTDLELNAALDSMWRLRRNLDNATVR